MDPITSRDKSASMMGSAETPHYSIHNNNFSSQSSTYSLFDQPSQNPPPSLPSLLPSSSSSLSSSSSILTTSMQALKFQPTSLVGDIPKAWDVEFFQWAIRHGVRCPKLSFPAYNAHGVRGFAANGDIDVEEDLLVVPSSLMLGKTVCYASADLGRVFAENIRMFEDDEDAVLATYIAYHRAVQKEKSFWWPYLRILPDIDVLADWTDEELQALQCPSLADLAKERRAEYELLAVTFTSVLCQRYPDIFQVDTFTPAWFSWAYKQVAARGFGSRLPEVLMVPLADCFNHGNVATKYMFEEVATAIAQAGAENKLANLRSRGGDDHQEEEDDDSENHSHITSTTETQTTSSSTTPFLHSLSSSFSSSSVIVPATASSSMLDVVFPTTTTTITKDGSVQRATTTYDDGGAEEEEEGGGGKRSGRMSEQVLAVSDAIPSTGIADQESAAALDRRSTNKQNNFAKTTSSSSLNPTTGGLNGGVFRMFPSRNTRYVAGEQVLFSYGRRDNTHLAMEYGFTLLDNEHDVVMLMPGSAADFGFLRLTPRARAIIHFASISLGPFKLKWRSLDPNMLTLFRAVAIGADDSAFHDFESGKIRVFNRLLSGPLESAALFALSTYLRSVSIGMGESVEEDEALLASYSIGVSGSSSAASSSSFLSASSPSAASSLSGSSNVSYSNNSQSAALPSRLITALKFRLTRKHLVQTHIMLAHERIQKLRQKGGQNISINNINNNNSNSNNYNNNNNNVSISAGGSGSNSTNLGMNSTSSVMSGTGKASSTGGNNNGFSNSTNAGGTGSNSNHNHYHNPINNYHSSSSNSKNLNQHYMNGGAGTTHNMSEHHYHHHQQQQQQQSYNVSYANNGTNNGPNTGRFVHGTSGNGSSYNNGCISNELMPQSMHNYHSGGGGGGIIGGSGSGNTREKHQQEFQPPPPPNYYQQQQQHQHHVPQHLQQAHVLPGHAPVMQPPPPPPPSSSVSTSSTSSSSSHASPFSSIFDGVSGVQHTASASSAVLMSHDKDTPQQQYISQQQQQQQQHHRHTINHPPQMSNSQHNSQDQQFF